MHIMFRGHWWCIACGMLLLGSMTASYLYMLVVCNVCGWWHLARYVGHRLLFVGCAVKGGYYCNQLLEPPRATERQPATVVCLHACYHSCCCQLIPVMLGGESCRIHYNIA